MTAAAGAKRLQLRAAIEMEAADFDPRIIEAQVIEETGWFKHIIGWNNFWGIKYSSRKKRQDMTDRQVRVPTSEEFGTSEEEQKKLARFWNKNLTEIISVRWDAKRKVLVIKCFAVFADWSREHLAVRYYRQIIKDLYPNAWKYRAGPAKDYFEGLVNGRYRWATRQGYPERCLKIYHRIKGA